MQRRIYLDYASLTPIDKRVAKVMRKYEKKEYGNPSALYASGVSARKVLDESRQKIAKSINAHSDEIVFTSGGTESNNLVLQKFADKHIVVSSIEHSSIIKNKKWPPSNAGIGKIFKTPKTTLIIAINCK